MRIGYWKTSQPPTRIYFLLKGSCRTLSTTRRYWSGEIVRIATALFWSLALFEFILTFSMMAVRGSDLNEFTVEFLKRALIISFGLFLLENHLALEQIIQGFRDSSSLVREGQIGKEYALQRPDGNSS